MLDPVAAGRLARAMLYVRAAELAWRNPRDPAAAVEAARRELRGRFSMQTEAEYQMARAVAALLDGEAAE